jgi:CHASE3 domain sensor protein
MKKITFLLAVALFTCLMLPTTSYSQENKHEQNITFKDQEYSTFSNIEVNDSLLVRLQNVANKMAGIFVISKTLKGTV